MRKDSIKVDNISFKYPNAQTNAIHSVSFEIKENEWIAIVGRNGSGKSTLAKLLNGLILPEEGHITIDDDIILAEETIWDVRKRIAMVFQNPDNQFVGTTVLDDIAFGLENHGIEKAEMDRRVQEVLNIVNMMEFKLHEPHSLSGGQKQRVAIAGALAIQPSILILDEATSMLDPFGRKEVIETIRNLHKDINMTVISITHDIEEAVHADRILIMHDGHLVQSVTPEELLTTEYSLESLGLASPFTNNLSKLLVDKGLPIKQDHLAQESLVNELCKLLLKK
ncbi:energy-coupling factor ABC transporter ATP-binding protein [Bacillus sp. JJ664]